MLFTDLLFTHRTTKWKTSVREYVLQITRGVKRGEATLFCVGMKDLGRDK